MIKINPDRSSSSNSNSNNHGQVAFIKKELIEFEMVETSNSSIGEEEDYLSYLTTQYEKQQNQNNSKGE